MQARVVVTTEAGAAASTVPEAAGALASGTGTETPAGNGAPAMDFWCGPRQCTTAWLVRDSTSEEDGEPYSFWVSVA
jgi:hypothetical protein